MKDIAHRGENSGLGTIAESFTVHVVTSANTAGKSKGTGKPLIKFNIAFYPKWHFSVTLLTFRKKKVRLRMKGAALHRSALMEMQQVMHRF